MQTAFVVKPRVALQARVTPKSQARRVMVASAPKPEQIDAAVKEAEEACSGGDQGEWYVWGTSGSRAPVGIGGQFRSSFSPVFRPSPRTGSARLCPECAMFAFTRNGADSGRGGAFVSSNSWVGLCGGDDPGRRRTTPDALDALDVFLAQLTNDLSLHNAVPLPGTPLRSSPRLRPTPRPPDPRTRWRSSARRTRVLTSAVSTRTKGISDALSCNFKTCLLVARQVRRLVVQSYSRTVVQSVALAVIAVPEQRPGRAPLPGACTTCLLVPLSLSSLL
jgi:hypothetical protein